MESKVQEALASTAPKKTRQWEAFLEREADLEREFDYAPTLDLEARVMESTAQIFKSASCSLKMKGSLVHALKEATVTTRAAMAILAKRAREKEGEKASSLSEREKDLIKQIEELKKKVKRLERQTRNPPQTPTPIFPRAKAKRRKMVEESKEEMNVTAPPNSQSKLPSPPQAMDKTWEGRKEEKASQVASGLCNAPPIREKLRQIEAYPPGIRPQDRAEFDSLAKQRASLAKEQNAISGNPEKVTEYLAIQPNWPEWRPKWKMSREQTTLTQSPSSLRNQGRREQTPPPQKTEGVLSAEMTSSPISVNKQT